MEGIEISPWAVALVVITFDETEGQVIQSIYPPNKVFLNFFFIPFLFFI